MKHKSLLIAQIVVGSIALCSLFFLPTHQPITENIGGGVIATTTEIKKLVEKKVLDDTVISAVPGEYVKSGITIDIKSIEKIDSSIKEEQGYQVYAQAFQDGKPIGFGKDGSVETERFIFYRTEFEGDPIEEIRYELYDTLLKVKKDGKNIQAGKVGNTTSTFYPSSDESIYVGDAVWNTACGATTGTLRGGDDFTAQNTLAGIYYCERAFVNYTTSALPDTDDISSVVMSPYGRAVGAGSVDFNVYGSTANDTIVAGDFDLVGSTAYSDTTWSSWPLEQYNDKTFNATGIANVSKTGISKFSIRNVGDDVGAGTPTVVNSINSYAVSTAGTSKDPKLVVEHAAPSVNPIVPSSVILFE